MALDKKFVDGLRFNDPHERAPKWVRGTISVNIKRFLPYAEENADERGWLNIDVKKSRDGNLYCELNTYRRDKTSTDKEDREYDQKADEGDGGDQKDVDLPF